MTAISFKSESGDDYLEISENETVTQITERLAEYHGDEWSFLEVVLVRSTDLDIENLRKAIIYSQ